MQTQLTSDRRRRDNLSKEERSRIGKLGGSAVSQNLGHMAEIGRKGGLIVSADRNFMREIGKKGGKAKGKLPIL